MQMCKKNINVTEEEHAIWRNKFSFYSTNLSLSIPYTWRSRHMLLANELPSYIESTRRDDKNTQSPTWPPAMLK